MSDETKPSDKSLETAAQCWCDEDTQHTEMDVALAYAFAKRLDAKQAIIDDLKGFCIWMTGCGYDFTQHPHFVEWRNKLLK